MNLATSITITKRIYVRDILRVYRGSIYLWISNKMSQHSYVCSNFYYEDLIEITTSMQRVVRAYSRDQMCTLGMFGYNGGASGTARGTSCWRDVLGWMLLTLASGSHRDPLSGSSDSCPL
jgi:hypothetical protein